MMKKAWQEKNFSVLAAVTATAATAAMIALLCAKSVRVLFKMDKALSIYIRQNDPRRQKSRTKMRKLLAFNRPADRRGHRFFTEEPYTK